MAKHQKTSAEGHGLPGSMEEIPRKLRQYYDSLQEEAIPARFLDLLEKLDQAERAALEAASTRGAAK